MLFEKCIHIFSTENAQPTEPALCQLYRHTFVPYSNAFQARAVSRSLEVQSIARVTTLGHRAVFKRGVRV